MASIWLTDAETASTAAAAGAAFTATSIEGRAWLTLAIDASISSIPCRAPEASALIESVVVPLMSRRACEAALACSSTSSVNSSRVSMTSSISSCRFWKKAIDSSMPFLRPVVLAEKIAEIVPTVATGRYLPPNKLASF